MKVYIVTSGEYSDYGIRAAFDNREAAEAFCALGNGDYVEEYDLLQKAAEEPTPRIVYRYHVYYPNRGTNFIGEPAYLFESNVESDKERIRKQKKYLTQSMRQDYNILDCNYHIDRYAYLKECDKSKALKIVRDRMAQAKAGKAGIT